MDSSRSVDFTSTVAELFVLSVVVLSVLHTLHYHYGFCSIISHIAVVALSSVLKLFQYNLSEKHKMVDIKCFFLLK